MEQNQQITLIAYSTKKEFQLSNQAASLSQVLDACLREGFESVDPVLIEAQAVKMKWRIEIPTTSEDHVSLVVEYLEHHNGKNPSGMKCKSAAEFMTDNCADPWDAAFIDRIWSTDKQLLYDLIHVSSRLRIDSLTLLGCVKIASVINVLPVEDIADFLSETHANFRI
jgi:hypothetical protein